VFESCSSSMNTSNWSILTSIFSVLTFASDLKPVIVVLISSICDAYFSSTFVRFSCNLFCISTIILCAADATASSFALASAIAVSNFFLLKEPLNRSCAAAISASLRSLAWASLLFCISISLSAWTLKVFFSSLILSYNTASSSFNWQAKWRTSSIIRKN
jgi:hypothetical protein